MDKTIYKWYKPRNDMAREALVQTAVPQTIVYQCAQPVSRHESDQF